MKTVIVPHEDGIHYRIVDGPPSSLKGLCRFDPPRLACDHCVVAEHDEETGEGRVIACRRAGCPHSRRSGVQGVRVEGNRLEIINLRVLGEETA